MTKPLGYILYEGPSQLDGAPIVVIATGFRESSANRKTGAMIQTYILRSDMAPVAAVHEGADASICGDCPHRGAAGNGSGRSCYVVLGQGPTVVYKAYKAGKYTPINYWDVFNGRMVRFGTYGDPAAAPSDIWGRIANFAAGWTGYTHQWRTAEDLKYFCMASADSAAEAAAAQQAGWRTFRVTAPAGEVDARLSRLLRESVCPASEEAGRKVTCLDCRACGGTATGRRGSITIQAHGGTAVMAAVNRLALA